MWQHASESQATTGTRRKKSVASGKGKAKATAAGGAQVGAESDQEAPPPPKKVQGRPRKNPLKEGEESPYMRRKREKAEDEERARQGLPPLVRVRGKTAKKKAGPAAEGGDEAGQPDASTSGAKTKKKNDSTAKKGKTAASAPANPEVSGARQNQLQLSEAGIV